MKIRIVFHDKLRKSTEILNKMYYFQKKAYIIKQRTLITNVSCDVTHVLKSPTWFCRTIDININFLKIVYVRYQLGFKN